MKRILLICFIITPPLFSQSVVVKTDESYFIYNQHYQLEIEASIKHRTVKLINRGVTTIYPNQPLNLAPFIALNKRIPFTTESGIKISTEDHRTSRYIDIANNLYKIEKISYIVIEEGSSKVTLEGEALYYSSQSHRIFYFRGDHLYYYDCLSGEEKSLAIKSKIVKSVNGDSSYRWVFEDRRGFLWIYNRFEAASTVAIYSADGRLEHEMMLPSAIMEIYVSDGVEDYKAWLGS